MAATSIALQLKALKSLVKSDSDIPKRPITKPSLLFDPKQAADLDLDTIFNISLSGFEALINIDERFRPHKGDLFSQKSKELDRELLGIEENNRINASISSYLRLLSGYLQSPSAFKTLEYLVRRYKIHVYNVEELILCALPYHDTHAFVRVVQLIDFGNSRWHFLEGVKASGAPPPREVIVQQCMRDMGVLEVVCNYATPVKKSQPSVPAISFCTAVVVEVLGSLPNVDGDVVNRILPFLDSGLKSGSKGSSEYKAGTLMIVGLLANRVTLSPKLFSHLTRSVAELFQADTHASQDVQVVQLSVMALVTIVQSQSVGILPKKVVDCLKEIGDLPGILSSLTKRFNIDRFLTLLLDSLIDHSHSDNQCKLALMSIIETVAIGSLVRAVVFRLLSACLRLSHNTPEPESSESGIWAKEILLLLSKKYSKEFRTSVHEFLEDKEAHRKGAHSTIDSLCKLLDGCLKPSVGFSDSRIWFALEHPRAEIRRCALSNLDLSAVLSGGVGSQGFVSIQDAVARCLSDSDLKVVRAALGIDKFAEVMDSALVLDMLRTLLRRCTRILWSEATREHQLACEIAVSCLKHLVSFVQDRNDLVEEIAIVMFPLLLVFRKTRSLNLKALELAKEVKWPFYTDLIYVPDLKKDPKDKKKAGSKELSAINMATLRSLANVFSANTKDFMPWLVKCCGEFQLSKTISFLVLLQLFSMENNVSCQLFTSHEACFSFLKREWIALEQTGKILSEQEFSIDSLDGEIDKILAEIDGFNLVELNTRIMVLVFWRLIKHYISTMSPDVAMGEDDTDKGISILRDLYVFFAESNSKHLFKEHRRYLVENSKASPIHFLSVFIAEEGVSSAVQVESLHSFSMLCSRALALELLAEFPLILISLSSDDQDVRIAAMNFAEDLNICCDFVTCGDEKDASGESWSPFVSELLKLLVQQKKFVLSDRNFLPSFLAFVLSPSFTSLVVPQDVGQRFEKHGIDIILAFILEYTMKLSGYAKLRIFTLLKELGGAIIVEDVEVLLCELLQRRRSYNFGSDKSFLELSSIDVDVLCLLIEICSVTPLSSLRVFEDRILPLLWIDGVMPHNDAAVRPCVTFLQNLNDNLYKSLSAKTQLSLFKNLVLLYHDANADVQIAARDAILRLYIPCSTIVHMLNSILASGLNLVGSSQRKKQKSANRNPEITFGGHGTLSFLSSLLDLLLLKKDMQNRSLVIEPLFELLRKAFSNEWIRVVGSEELVQSSSGVSQTTSHMLCYIQQTLLLILEDIISSLSDDTSSSCGILDKVDAALLVECARSTEDVVTRNHVYSLFATISKVKPDKVVHRIPDICAVIGQSTVTQNDSHSNRVLEDFISAVVPCWLSNTGDANELLRIFVNVMPDVTSQRRLSIVLHLLKTLGEKSSMGSLLVLLFHSLASKEKIYSFLDDEVGVSESMSSAAQTEWEFSFATQLCEQYTCMIWLPSLVSLLKQLQKDGQDRKQFLKLLFALRFIMEKLQDPELVFKLQAMEDIETLQGILSELMVQVVSCWRLCDLSRKKKSLQVGLKKEFEGIVHSVLAKIRKGMLPSAFFQGINRLLVEDGKRAKKKALQVLCETARESDIVKSKKERRPNVRLTNSWHHLEGNDLDSFDTLCMEILQLLDNSRDLDVNVRLAAISALEALARKFPSNHTVFSKCLSSVMKLVISDDLAVGSCCLRTAGALINVLGPRALPELPQIMTNVLKRTSDALSSSESAEDDSSNRSSNDSIMLSVLVTLEALVENLGAFLNPYLEDIIELMVSHPDYISVSNQKLKSKADAVRKLLTEKVALRLALPALQKVYPKAVKLGDVSVSVVFELLENFVGKMDKLSVSGYHANVFDLCMLALDLRSQRVASVKNISVVEKRVIDAVIALTMKMTETMFKPLFVRSIEWAELKFEDDDSTDGRNIGRALSFYGLVEKLAENHRSLFVPYFKYLIDASVRYLTDEVGKVAGNLRKKKKAKVDKTERNKKDANDASSLEKWHLRALIMSSLHKCFLYDTGSVKFLDSSRFQLLLKPIVSQLVVEPPPSLEEHPEIPSMVEVDDVLVSCISQMAVTAGSDLFWKPLNYEVLMQTRSELVRSRLLGLRIIKRLVENLKEEYLVLLAETIPFLAELLEDVELSVKTLAQEILKEMEALSGENLRQYF